MGIPGFPGNSTGFSSWKLDCIFLTSNEEDFFFLVSLISFKGKNRLNIYRISNPSVKTVFNFFLCPQL